MSLIHTCWIPEDFKMLIGFLDGLAMIIFLDARMVLNYLYDFMDARTLRCCRKLCGLTVEHRWASLLAQSSVVRDSKHLSLSVFNMTGRTQPPIRGVHPLADIHVRSTLLARELLRFSNSLRRSRVKNPSVSRLRLHNLQQHLSWDKRLYAYLFPLSVWLYIITIIEWRNKNKHLHRLKIKKRQKPIV
jgi:hypothetical protein